jgi:glycosyltransferase involved in cell wall biosynthesis
MKAAVDLIAPLSLPPVKLLIDGRKLGHGGIGVYTENLIQGLLQLGGASIAVISTEAQADRVAFARDVEWIFDSARPYSVDELFFLSRRIPFSRFDLFHAPHYILPFGIPIPTVITVHDLIHIEHPERFFYPIIAKPLLSSAISRATRVIAVSRDTQRSLITSLGVSADKVHHIPNAISAFLGRDGSRDNQASAGSSARPYLLSVLSNVKPHKGLEDLLRAYRGLQTSGAFHDLCPDLFLVGYGAERIGDIPGLRALVEGVRGVHVLGAVGTTELRDLYRKARALVVPSLAEGFCLPALEAQACGTPVICRPVPAIRELLTEQDIVASDMSVEGLAVALAAGCARADRARLNIDMHLARFSLPVVATQVRSLYEEVLRGAVTE